MAAFDWCTTSQRCYLVVCRAGRMLTSVSRMLASVSRILPSVSRILPSVSRMQSWSYAS